MKFLIVDDDRACRELAREFLSPYGQCDLAFDGKEAVNFVRLALADGNPYDLVCLDIMMPGMDGHQALEAIRELEARFGRGGSEGVKIVMTTALRDSKHCIRAFREGCESYCPKPLTQAELLGHVRRLLGELPEPSPRRQPADPSAPASPNPSKSSDSKRFLIVDDDGVCRELLRAMLSPYGHCDVAYDGREAIDAVRLALEDGEPYDLITLDIMMPGTDGHQALEAIRKLEVEFGRSCTDGVKIIMTTALRDSKHCIRSFREGCESYVTKPVNEEELLGRMAELGVLEGGGVRHAAV